MPKEISDNSNAAREESLTMFLDFNSMYQMAQFTLSNEEVIDSSN